MTTPAKRRPMKVGIFSSAIIPGGIRDGALGWNDLKAMAQLTEQAGFDSFWLPDHLIFKNPGETPHGPWECWSTIAAMAAVTNRIELGTAVSCVSFRNPALLAKMVDTIDEISGGRVILGLGAGWHEPEYQAFGYPFDHRFLRFDEALTIITSLLRTGKADFQGEYHQVDDCELRPRGPRPAGPPILIGALASKPRMLGMVAKYADIWNGWLLHTRSHPDQVPAMREAVDAACVAIGRDPATLKRSIGIGVDQRPAGERPTVDYRDDKPQPLTGSPAEVAAAVRGFADEGINHIQLTPIIQGVAGIEALIPVLELLDK